MPGDQMTTGYGASVSSGPRVPTLSTGSASRAGYVSVTWRVSYGAVAPGTREARTSVCTGARFAVVTSKGDAGSEPEVQRRTREGAVLRAEGTNELLLDTVGVAADGELVGRVALGDGLAQDAVVLGERGALGGRHRVLLRLVDPVEPLVDHAVGLLRHELPVLGSVVDGEAHRGR